MKIDQILLGLIRIHPSVTGYQLKTIINQSTGYFFQAHLSQIYPSLKRMSEDGLLTAVLVPQNGKPDQKLYTLTDKGFEALADWLKEPFSFELKRENFSNYLVKLTLMGHLEDSHIRNYLETGIKTFKEELSYLENENLSIEKGFLANPDGQAENRYLKIWNSEMGYLRNDIELKIAWLEKLFVEFAEEHLDT